MNKPHQGEVLPESYRGREQTFIKHLILRRYLERVARNILWSQREFVFIDGFSGPWEARLQSYEDTSFGIALRLLREVRDQLKASGLERRVRCIFVEKGASAFARLSAAVSRIEYMEVRAIHGRFEDHADDLARSIGNAFALIFVDPRGWRFDLRQLVPLLRHRPNEVLINFMYEHFNRFLDDQRAGIRASYVLPLGIADWRKRLDHLLASGLGREDAIMDLFRQQLKAVGQFDYVLSTRIQRPTSDRSHFYLVYGTRHPKGLVEFRKVEKQAMETEGLARLEAKHDKRVARTGQEEFRLDSPRPLVALRKPEAERTQAWLARQLEQLTSMSYEDALAGALERFSVTESELKDILVGMRDLGIVVLHGMKPRQRKPSEGVVIVRASTGRS